MRVKFQMRNAAGMYEDVFLDPGQKRVLALEFVAGDLEYISRRRIVNGSQRLIVGAMPLRIRTKLGVTGTKDVLDIFVSRPAGDWMALELTPLDVKRLAAATPGDHSTLLVNATMPNKAFSKQELHAFMANWPVLDIDTHFPDNETGAPRSMRGNEAKTAAFLAWAKDWPPVFHSTEKAPEARLILPNGSANDG